jgi:hypothetical protein
MYDASSETRKTAARATLSTKPLGFIEVASRHAFQGASMTESEN